MDIGLFLWGKKEHAFLCSQLRFIQVMWFAYIRPAQPFWSCGPLSHEEIYCRPQTFLWLKNKRLWRNKSIDFDELYAITQGNNELYSYFHALLPACVDVNKI